mgnify:CR=1 FL=1
MPHPISAERRRVLLASLALASSPVASLAQSFPARPIRIVVPFPAGGSTDMVARVLGQKLSASLGQPVVVDNKPGANMVIGIMDVAKAPADGHTILYAQTGIVQNPLLNPNTQYDVFRDFAPVIQVAEATAFFVVPVSVPAQNLKEFFAWAKTQPNAAFASTGQGSSTHIYGEMLNQATGLKLTHVPYKGEAPIVPDLLASRVQCAWCSGLTASQLSKDGKIRVLATTGLKRQPLLPEVPTFAEAGLEGLDIEGWTAMFVPRATPPAVLAKLASAFDEALKAPDVREKMLGAALPPVGGSPRNFEDVLRRSHTGWKAAIAKTGVRAE